MAVLSHGNSLIAAGYMESASQPPRYQLTCTDTLGNLRWQHDYPRPNNASNDYCNAVVRTPRGGYLLSGDAQILGGWRHYLIETDSLGRQLRQRLITPFAPNITDGFRFDKYSNVLVLPNAQGYLLSGTTDSSFQANTTGYIVRLDTALNITWAYRHPPAYQGNGNRSQYGYKIRFLPNNTVGILLTDVRGNGTPDTYLAQVDVATGQRVATYVLSSNTQSAVAPYDWQWLGDGTLLLSGQAWRTGTTGPSGYVARWDFRATPLGAGLPTATRPATGGAGAALVAWPNPATETVSVDTQNRGAASVELLDLTGRVLRAQPVAAGAASATLGLAGLPPGLYLLRLRGAAGQGLGTAKVVVAP